LPQVQESLPFLPDGFDKIPAGAPQVPEAAAAVAGVSADSEEGLPPLPPLPELPELPPDLQNMLQVAEGQPQGGLTYAEPQPVPDYMKVAVTKAVKQAEAAAPVKAVTKKVVTKAVKAQAAAPVKAVTKAVKQAHAAAPVEAVAKKAVTKAVKTAVAPVKAVTEAATKTVKAAPIMPEAAKVGSPMFLGQQVQAPLQPAAGFEQQVQVKLMEAHIKEHEAALNVKSKAEQTTLTKEELDELHVKSKAAQATLTKEELDKELVEGNKAFEDSLAWTDDHGIDTQKEHANDHPDDVTPAFQPGDGSGKSMFNSQRGNGGSSQSTNPHEFVR